MSNAHDPSVRTVQVLAALVDLARRARLALSRHELGFLLVNDTVHLSPYRQAALWSAHEGIHTLSGVVQPEANAPYVQWLNRLSDHLASAGSETSIALTAASLPADLAEEWAQWWPAHALWLPMSDPTNPKATGQALLLARETPWPEDELRLLGEWLATWRHASLVLTPSRPLGWRGVHHRLTSHWRGQPGQAWWRQARWRWLALCTAVMFVPIRLSVLAPGELVPAHPITVRAPLDGVVETFHVQPNQVVTRGQPLFGFDEALIQSRVNVAQQELATAEAEYRQTSQQALNDAKSKGQLAVLIGKIEEKRAEVGYLNDQLTRTRVLAPRDGMVLFDDPSEWIGRPVNTGERIMRIAAPDDREIEAWLPLADAIHLEPEASVKLYLNASPLSPVEAQVRYLAHDAVQRPDGSYAYRLRARLTGPTAHRVGLKGTTRIEGEQTVLAYWMLRRPLAALRTTLGQ